MIRHAADATKFLALGTLLWGMLLAASCAGAEASGSLLQEGTSAFDKGDYDRAIEAFDGVIASDPESKQAYYFLGKCWLAKGNDALAECDFTTAIALDPKNADAYNCRGDAYNRAGDYELAIGDYTEALQLRPGFAEAQKSLDLVHKTIDEAQKNDELAQENQELVEKGLEEDEKTRNPQSDQFCSEGLNAQLRSDWNTAVADFTKAMELNPRNVTAILGRANAYGAESQFEKAIEDWDRLIQLHPFFAAAYRYRSERYSQLGDMKRALADADRAVHLAPDSDRSFYFRGNVYLRMGDFDKAIADFSQSLHPDPKVAQALRDPTDPPENNIENFALIENPLKTYYWRGVAYLSRASKTKSGQDIDSAIADLRQQIQQTPGDIDSHMSLLYALARKGDDKSVAAEMGKMVDIAKDAESCNAVAWIMATSLDPKLHDGKKAVDYASRACQLSNWKDPYIIDTFAAACAEAGNFADAIKFQTMYLASPILTPQNRTEGKARLDLYKNHKPYRQD